MKPQAESFALNERVAHAVKTLEETLGIPVQSKQRPNPIDMLIATILSQNTNDQNSYRAYRTLREKFSTWEAVRDARTSAIISAIKTGGMANQKSVRIKKLLQELTQRYGSLDSSFLKRKSTKEVFDLLTSLDGVGTKTAACVLLFSLRREIFPVDTHIFRICNRLGFTVNSKSPDKTFEAMQPLVPEGKAYSFHTNLIRFGRKICKATSPLCGDCPLYDTCRFDEKERYATNTSAGAKEKDYEFMILDNVAKM